MAPRVENFDDWAWHIIDGLRAEQARNPTDRLRDRIAELEALLPDRPAQPGPDYLGFAVPLRLRPDMRLLTTLTRFGTAADVTVAELRLEAFLPADEQTADALTRLTAR